jgi:cyclophilin family peptidyl-prolyl cis-trans isomerase
MNVAIPKLFRWLAAILGLTIASAAFGANPVVVVETSHGAIKIELFEDKAPITVKNFLTYVDEKHYDGTIFHRVMSDFMIQGGGFDVNSTERPTHKPIKNESDNGLSNKRGTIAMARTKMPDTATAQFFINVVDNQNLDRSDSDAGYCVFGRVIEGMETVDSIRKVKVARSAISNAQPLETVEIKSVRRAK